MTVWIYFQSIPQMEPMQEKAMYSVEENGPLRSGRSRSYKVIEIGTTRKPVCDFLVVFYCNCVPIFYRFRDYDDLLEVTKTAGVEVTLLCPVHISGFSHLSTQANVKFDCRTNSLDFTPPPPTPSPSETSATET